MPYLIVNTNNRDYQIYRFLKKINIGRHPDCNVMLKNIENKTISRHHAYIQREKKAFLLVDCSLNGTQVDNKLIENHRLQHEDRFQIGDYTLTFLDDIFIDIESQQHLIDNIQKGNGDQFEKTEKIEGSETIKDNVSDSELKKKLTDIGIIAEDEQMLTLYRDVLTVSQINVPVLITGEPGTGKEKVAQAIHDFSQAEGEFVAVNCPTIPENLFESELFGSVKGAFSDAENKCGKLEIADNGTIFLDEIGDMVLGCQPKLLRFLESRSLSRLGETRIRKLNIRIVAATNQNLKKMLETKTFRSDLFQRLACVRLHIEPLRKRKKDILPLANFFLENYARKYELKPKKISTRASKLLLTYPWPGNVRELANLMLNIIVRTKEGNITPQHLTAASEEIGKNNINIDTDIVSLQMMEKKHIHKALKQAGNNKTKACEILGISKDTLYRKIKKYQIAK